VQSQTNGRKIDTEPVVVPQQHAFKGWPLVTIVLLMLGYTGYYFCR